MVCFLVLSLSRHFGSSPLEYILLPYSSKKKKKRKKKRKETKVCFKKLGAFMKAIYALVLFVLAVDILIRTL